jgi:maleate cis-trans isomerase
MSKESLLAVDRFTMSMSLSRIQLKASTNQELYVMSSDVKSFKMNISDSGAIPGQS